MVKSAIGLVVDVAVVAEAVSGVFVEVGDSSWPTSFVRGPSYRHRRADRVLALSVDWARWRVRG